MTLYRLSHPPAWCKSQGLAEVLPRGTIPPPDFLLFDPKHKRRHLHALYRLIRGFHAIMGRSRVSDDVDHVE